jgi:hypothetical protein
VWKHHGVLATENWLSAPCASDILGGIEYIMAEQQNSEPSRVPNARSCWYYGCFTLGMMLLVGFLSIYFGGRYFLKTFVAEYTSEKADPLPRVEMDDASWNALKGRIADFSKALRESKEDAVLELSADDLNALIQKDPQFSEFSGHLFVSFEGEKASCKFSYLLERLGAQKILHGRFLNGTAELVPNMVNGELFLTLLNVQINGKTVPDSVKPGLQAHNLAANFNSDEKSRPFLHRVRGISIQRGKVIIVVRSVGGNP